ncbi:DUF397 domain-containing protein [Streptomyces sp. NPDC003042]
MHSVSPSISGATWIKSSYSGAEHSECVEAAFLVGSTGVRDSKRPMGGTILFRDEAWRAFLEGLRSEQP